MQKAGAVFYLEDRNIWNGETYERGQKYGNQAKYVNLFKEKGDIGDIGTKLEILKFANIEKNAAYVDMDMSMWWTESDKPSIIMFMLKNKDMNMEAILVQWHN